jgi:hypothetical protein
LLSSARAVSMGWSSLRIVAFMCMIRFRFRVQSSGSFRIHVSAMLVGTFQQALPVGMTEPLAG